MTTKHVPSLNIDFTDDEIKALKVKYCVHFDGKDDDLPSNTCERNVYFTDSEGRQVSGVIKWAMKGDQSFSDYMLTIDLNPLMWGVLKELGAVVMVEHNIKKLLIQNPKDDDVLELIWKKVESTPEKKNIPVKKGSRFGTTLAVLATMAVATGLGYGIKKMLD